MSAIDVRVRLPTVLRQYAGGQSEVALSVDEPATVGPVLDALEAVEPDVARRRRDEMGSQRPHVNLFLGSDNIKDIGGLAATVGAGAELQVLAAVSGGA